MTTINQKTKFSSDSALSQVNVDKSVILSEDCLILDDELIIDQSQSTDTRSQTLDTTTEHDSVTASIDDLNDDLDDAWENVLVGWQGDESDKQISDLVDVLCASGVLPSLLSEMTEDDLLSFHQWFLNRSADTLADD